MENTLKQQRVGVTTELLDLIQVRIKQLGISSIPEYFRHLAINDVKILVDHSNSMLDAETEKKVGRGLDDYKNKKFVRVTNKKELEDLFDVL